MSHFIDNLIVYSLSLFFVTYLINYAEIFSKIRNALFPVLPWFVLKAVSCGFCLSFWVMLVSGFFLGHSILLLCVPVFVLFLDTIFQRLRR